MSGSSLSFSSSELRIVTLTLSAVAAAVPLFYLIRGSPQPSLDSSPHIRTFEKYIAAYSSRRPQALVANATSSFKHTVLPSTLGIPARTLTPFKIHAATIFSLFQDFSMVPQPMNEGKTMHFCRDTNTVVAYCKMGGQIDGKNENGRKLVDQGIWEWWLECVLFVEMDKEGKRVVGVREFVDGVKSEQLKEKLMGVLEG